MSVLDLARADIRVLQPYASARMEAGVGEVWLNANESALAPYGDRGAGCHRYPEPQPATLVAALGELYGASVDQLLLTRGSDDGIDLLVRAFCRAGEDAILVQVPTFGMYAVSARIQGAGVVAVPLARDFSLDVDAVLGAVTPAVKLVFVCAPNNPSGQGVERSALLQLADALADRALLVVDEAYVEFADDTSATALLARYPHLVVLRTLSKAWALAGARIGSVLAGSQVINLLRRILPPYPLPRPCVDAALRALSMAGQANARQRIAEVCAQRAQVASSLRRFAAVREVLPSQANFLTVRFHHASAAHRRLLDAGVVVRDVSRYPRLDDALRITIGTPAENARMLDVLQELAA
ncbi:MAG: histidinol-phosphate transaminase [Rhodanobacter sp.]